MEINKLSELEAKQAKPGKKEHRLSDGSGLYLVVKAEVIIDELTSLPKEQSEMPKYTEAAAIAGEDVVYYAMKLSGASNAKAKRVLEWKPRRLEWLEA